LNETIHSIITEIRSIDAPRPVYIAFSGGMDSTVAASIAVEALGKSQVILVHVSFGEYAYSQTQSNVLFVAKRLGCELVWVKGKSKQEQVLRYGPSCNLCTKRVKLAGVRSVKPFEAILISGANQSDSWGTYGKKRMLDTYSPLFELDKPMIKQMLDHYGIPLDRVRAGESEHREGCTLKHLMKMLAAPAYHGSAVSESNETLLGILREKKFQASLANVKVIGPLSRNIALVNVLPTPDSLVREEICEKIMSINTIDEAHWLDTPIHLEVIANPSVVRTKEARYWLEKGKFAPEFAVPVRCSWRESKNTKLRTYQVVGFKKQYSEGNEIIM